MYLILIVLLFIAISILNFIFRDWDNNACNYWRSRSVHFIKPAPLLSGSILKSVFITPSRLSDMYKRAQRLDYIGFFQVRSPVLLVCCPNLADVILRKEFNSFTMNRSEETVNEDNDPLSMNLFSLSFQLWRVVRREVARLFAPQCMKNFEEYLDEHSDRFISELKNEFNDDGFVEVTKFSRLFSVRMILSCTMGDHLPELTSPKSIHPILEEKSLQHGFWPMFWWNIKLLYPNFFKFLRLSGYREGVRDFFLKRVNEVINNVRKDSDKNQFLSKLVINRSLKDYSVHKDSFTNMICAQVYTLFVGGTDSVTTTLSCALYELARHPDIFKKVREEALTTLDTFGSFTNSALMNLYYLDCVIKETLRLHPPGYSIMRKCTNTKFLPEFLLEVEKGTTVVIPVLELQMDPKYFNNPKQFDPLRFTEPNALTIIPGSYLPFGDGPRRCFGLHLSMLELKIAIAKLSVEFEGIELFGSHDEPLQTEDLSRVYMLKTDLFVKFKMSDSAKSN